MMFDTPVTVVGNLMTAPEWRRTAATGTFVVSFKVASTSRRFDKERNKWVDGDSLRVKVACWRRLGENVSISLQLGDPVIVYGRMYSRDWTDDEGNRRTSYELDAVAVGHDLSRGVDKFARRKAPGATDVINDAAGAASLVASRPSRSTIRAAPTTCRRTVSCSRSSIRWSTTPRRSSHRGRSMSTASHRCVGPGSRQASGIGGEGPG
jgi:single-strand DNA-binding protein